MGRRVPAWIPVLVVLAIAAISVEAAEEKKPPFELPITEKWSQLIPDGLSMKFFHGKWNYISRGHGIPVDVTAEAFVNMAAPEDAPYRSKPHRVLYEARNYVLIARLIRSENSAWTGFRVLTLQSRTDDPFSEFVDMFEFSCTDPSMKGGDHAFSWTRERLLKVLATSRWCALDIDLDRASLGLHWSFVSYVRRVD